MLETEGKMDNKIQGLNIIKIVACVIIICHHYQQYMNLYFVGKVNFFNGNFYFGYVVDLFFMISGMLAYHTYTCRGGIRPFGEYMKSKFLKFFPISFISLTTLYVFEWIVYLFSGESYFWKLPTLVDYVLSLLFLDSGWGFGKLVPDTRITWYISILLILYALFWLACKMCEKKQIQIEHISFLCIIFGSAILFKEDELLFREYPIVNNSFARGIVSFYIGILVYTLLKKHTKIMKLYAYVGFLLTSVFMIYDYLKTASIANPLLGSAYWACILVLYPSILIIFTTSKFIGKLSSFALIDELGKLTFPVYIYQANFIVFYMFVLEKYNIFVNHGYKSMLLFSIGIFAVCVPLHTYIDIPFEKKVRQLFTQSIDV